MLKSQPIFLKSGKPSSSAFELYVTIKAGLAMKSGSVRMHFKTYGGRGKFSRLNCGEHWAAIDLLKQAGVEFNEGNDAPRGGAIGDYIELSRPEAQKFVKMIAKAAD